MGQKHPSDLKVLELRIQYKEHVDEGTTTIDSVHWKPCHAMFNRKKLLLTLENGQEKKMKLNNNFSLIYEDPVNFVLSISYRHREFKFIGMIRAENFSDMICMENYIKKAKRPQWQESSSCQLCKNKFTSVRRRHHCRKCGRIVCQKCSKFRQELKILGYNNLQRICKECAKPSKSKTDGITFTFANV